MIGTRLGPYEITAKLAEGGMGEVWRASDPRLGREVAVKVLPADVGHDPERLKRFEQEARAVGALNHPNILTVHDVGASGGVHYLVTELLEGETLRERLERGRVPVAEATGIALAVARGLSAAEERGVAHRDLKPENIFLTRRGEVKILDFGLAKPHAEDGHRLATAATVDNLTRAGAVFGTLAYMSPEQARGEPADERSDRFAFGSVLYELLTGRPAFSAASSAETVASILRDDPPPVGSLRSEVPRELEQLTARCLAKEPAQRPRSAAELVAVLERASGGALARRGRLALALVAAGAVAVLGVVLLARRWESPRAAAPAANRVSQLTFAEGLEESPALSPDGARLVYSVGGSGLRHLRLRELEGGAERDLTGGELDELQPAWFPDGRRLLFVRARTAGLRLEPRDLFGAFVGGDIWELDLESGRATRRIENAFNPAVSPDGRRVAFDAAWAGGSRIWVAEPNGGNAEQVTADSSEAISHLRPRWSPDGRRLVFHAQERTRFDVRVVELATRRTIAATDDVFLDVDPAFGSSPDVVYFSSHRSGGLNLWRVELDGERAGAPRQVTTGAGQDVELAFDGSARRGVFSTLRQNADLWTLPLDPATGLPAGAPAPLVGSAREESRGAWSPDGRTVAFNSDRAGEMNLWLLDRSGSEARPLTRGAGGDYQASWSPDGRTIAFFSSRGGSVDLWAVEVATGELRQLSSDPGMEINPSYSPDGRRIAFQSDRSGRLELWVANADGGEARQLTEEGVIGHFQRWLAGGTILYRCICGGRNVVRAIAADGGAPRDLPWVTGGSHLSLSPDGRRALDVVDHKALWLSPLAGGESRKVFEFADAADRIDYPVWSPGGGEVLFDRFRPEDGDLWLLEPQP